MTLSSIKNYLTEASLYSRSIKTSDNLISDYIKDNMDKIFTDPEGAIKYNYDPDKNTLDFDSKETSKYIEMDLGILSDISDKLKCDIKNPIRLHFYHNPNIYFGNERTSKTGFIENLFLDIVFEKNLSSNVGIYFKSGTGNFRNSNIQVTKPNKNKTSYHFDNNKFELFRNQKELEKYLKDSIFNNPGSIVQNNHSGQFIMLKFEMNEFNKYYDSLEEELMSMDGSEDSLKEYQKHFLKNVSSGKYNIEIINMVGKDYPQYNTLFHIVGGNLNILLKTK